jgi:hypothetical protein
MITDDLNRVEGYSHLRKDTSNGGVVNVDKKAYEQHLRIKRIAQQKVAEKEIAEQSINNMREEINCIKDDMTEIKGLLLNLLNKGKQ